MSEINKLVQMSQNGKLVKTSRIDKPVQMSQMDKLVYMNLILKPVKMSPITNFGSNESKMTNKLK